MIVHLGNNGVTLCGYMPANGWAFDADRWTDTSQPQSTTCSACAKVLQAQSNIKK
jgi:hypothetical protein